MKTTTAFNMTTTAVLTCINVNECVERSHDCDVNADCFDRDGDFYCECIAGFEGKGQTCTDIDECVEGSIDRSGIKGRYEFSPSICHGNNVCVNTEGMTHTV